ncbi:HlyD family secretion protein [Antricoccus suffuscus]|uniref:HlyD family secretion protein n=1 Tax=Antricoccus suffuscus TaxID=1629062 RepID=A0A2T1A0W0_9ACTN|nr:biotin/lipoyl-binding protein [Antricoccus suffuscus]PRZ42241.1 HlyD family secretion protein [Antricoccus suffuscus]
MAVAAVVVIGGVLAYTTRTPQPSYRVASATKDDVQAVVTASGTIEQVNTANIGFVTSGQVSSIAVAVGQQVSAGETLASLDAANLQNALTAAQAAVAAAQAKLAADQSGELGTGAAPAIYIKNGTLQVEQVDDSGTSASSQLQAIITQQAALVDAQHAADAALIQTKTDLAAEETACQAFVTASPTGTPAQSQACTTAVQAVQADQTALNADQAAVGTDESGLAGALSTLIASEQSAPTTTPAPVTTSPPSKAPPATTAPAPASRPAGPTASGPSASANSKRSSGAGSGASTSKGSGTGGSGTANGGSGDSGNSGSSGRSGSAVRPATPQQLAADQAQIDLANAELTQAQQNVDQASVVSPIAGTVATVSVTVGQSVQASTAADPQFVVVGSGADEVTAHVNDTTVGRIKVGDSVQVLPDGQSSPIAGSVAAIGMLSTSSPASYPVTIAISGDAPHLYAGGSVQDTIVLGSVKHVLTVPTSAVHNFAALHTVTVDNGGKTTTVPVVVGLVGPNRTQIVSGLKSTAVVVLANLDETLPTTTSTTTRGLGGHGRAFGGG